MTKKKNQAEEETMKETREEKPADQNVNSQSEPSQESKNGADENTSVRDKGDTKPGNGEENAATKADQGPSADEKLAEMQDRYLRLSAEFDNYRKRTVREKIELTKHAGEEILRSVVPVLDDLERAVKSSSDAADCAAMKSGIDLIYNKFREILKQNGLKEIEAVNEPFNVDLHEAISKMKVEDENLKGKVVDVIQKGYYLHDKVMRFSKVVVGE